MNLLEKLEQEKKMVIEIPMQLAEAVRKIAKDVKPNEYIFEAIVEKIKIDILRYQTASGFANDHLVAYEKECQAKKKQESTN